MRIFARLKAKNKILVVRWVHGSPMDRGLLPPVTVREHANGHASINASSRKVTWRKVFTADQRDG